MGPWGGRVLEQDGVRANRSHCRPGRAALTEVALRDAFRRHSIMVLRKGRQHGGDVFRGNIRLHPMRRTEDQPRAIRREFAQAGLGGSANLRRGAGRQDSLRGDAAVEGQVSAKFTIQPRVFEHFRLNRIQAVQSDVHQVR